MSYYILEKLGEGGFAEVYKVKKNNKFYAMKIIKMNAPKNILKSVETEIKLLGELSKSPNCNKSIACIYEGYRDGDTFRIIMEYIKGDTLGSLVDELSPSNIINIFLQSVKTLEYIHEHGVLHRDIKPDNIMYDNGKIVFVDFGISCTFSNLIIPCEGNPGTKKYIDPSVLTNMVKYDHPRSDIYSLGATMYALVTKESPECICEPKQIEQFYNKYINNLDKYSNLYSFLTNYIKQMINPNISSRPTITDIINSLNKNSEYIQFTPEPIKLNKPKTDLTCSLECKEEYKEEYKWEDIKKSILEIYEDIGQLDLYNTPADFMEEEIKPYFKNRNLSAKTWEKINKFVLSLTFPYEEL